MTEGSYFDIWKLNFIFFLLSDFWGQPSSRGILEITSKEFRSWRQVGIKVTARGCALLGFLFCLSSTWLESDWLWRKAAGPVTINGDLFMQVFFFQFKNFNSCSFWGIWMYCNIMKFAANTVTSWHSVHLSMFVLTPCWCDALPQELLGGRASLTSHSDQSRDEGWMGTIQLGSWHTGLAIRHRVSAVQLKTLISVSCHSRGSEFVMSNSFPQPFLRMKLPPV